MNYAFAACNGDRENLGFYVIYEYAPIKVHNLCAKLANSCRLAAVYGMRPRIPALPPPPLNYMCVIGFI